MLWGVSKGEGDGNREPNSCGILHWPDALIPLFHELFSVKSIAVVHHLGDFSQIEV